jgi:hypothetical protein
VDSVSSLRQPSGPLPARVYWTRRLLVLVGLVIVIALTWWAVDRATATNASSSPPAGTAAQHRTPPRPAAHQAAHDRATNHQTPAPVKTSTSAPAGTVSAAKQTATPPHRAKQQPLPAAPTHALGSTATGPSGACDPARVGIAIHVTAMVAGNPHNIALRLTSPQGSSCRLAIGADDLVVEITSGSDRVWTSDECPETLPVKNVQLTAGTLSRYRFQWDGFRSIKGCRNNVTMARPGGYWVHAALLGGEPTEAYFAVKPRA